MNDIRTVDLNNADVEELKALEGIGQGRAEEIVRYRTEHGPFTDIEQLRNVPHVGNMPPAELEAVQRKLCIRPMGARKPRVEQDI